MDAYIMKDVVVDFVDFVVVVVVVVVWLRNGSISRRSVNSVQLISHTVHFFFTSQDLKKNVRVKNRVRQSRNSIFT